MIRNEVKLAGTVVNKSYLKSYESGNVVYFTMQCAGKQYRVQAWDEDCSFINDNVIIGDTLNIVGYFHPYYDKTKKEHKWFIKTRCVGKLSTNMAKCKIDGIINCDTNSRQTKQDGIINFTLKTDKDHSNVIYCNAPEHLSNYIVKGSHIFLEGNFDLNDASRIVIDVDKISYSQDF